MWVGVTIDPAQALRLVDRGPPAEEAKKAKEVRREGGREGGREGSKRASNYFERLNFVSFLSSFPPFLPPSLIPPSLVPCLLGTQGRAPTFQGRGHRGGRGVERR